MPRRVLLHPVSFRFESDAPEMVEILDANGESPSAAMGDDPLQSASDLWVSIVESLIPPEAPANARKALAGALANAVMPVGVDVAGNAIFTVGIPVPLSEPGLDILQDSDWRWITLSKCDELARPAESPMQRSGVAAQTVDFWRQAFEETDAALDFVPEFLTLWQVRRMYDAIWGYPQDSSGFKRWAVDREGAFAELLAKVDDGIVETEFEEELASIGGAAAGVAAGRAMTIGAVVGSLAFPTVALPLAVSAAVAANRLHRKHGRPPTWYQKTDKWKRGANWIANVYPPRPNWTIWDI